MSTSIQCALASAQQGVPLTDVTYLSVLAAMSGGSGTVTYFQNQFLIGNFVT